MTGRIQYTPEAAQQLNQLDEWITEKASVDIARRSVSAGQPHNANDDRDQPLSVPRFPWYCR